MSQFECAVCGNKLKETTAKGLPNFVVAPNHARICLDDVDNHDRVAMLNDGRITLVLQQEGDLWQAVNRTGRLRFTLSERSSGVPINLTFTDAIGAVWQGRYYPVSKTAVFQRKRAIFGMHAAPPAGGNGGVATAKGRRRATAKPAKNKT